MIVRAAAGSAQCGWPARAAILASDGKTVLHPEPARFFAVPLQGPLPEGLNYIP